MIDNMEFVALSDEEHAAIVGGGPTDFLLKTLVAIAAAECIKYWTELKQGYKAGYDDAFR